MSDLLDFGTKTRRRPRWLTWVAAAVTIALLAVGWVVSDRRADREQAGLRTCARAADAAVTNAEKRLAALATYIAPSVRSTSYELYEALYSILSQDAARQRPSVEQAHELCRAVDVWWVHVSQRRARDNYVALTTAELDRLDVLIEDGTKVYQGYDVIRQLHHDARSSVD